MRSHPAWRFVELRNEPYSVWMETFPVIGIQEGEEKAMWSLRYLEPSGINGGGTLHPCHPVWGTKSSHFCLPLPGGRSSFIQRPRSKPWVGTWSAREYE
jgi:hypothetical protein